MTSFSDYLQTQGVFGHALLAEAMERTEAMVRQRLRECGYGLMHRRKGQFWVVLNKPMTLHEIDQLRERGMLPDISAQAANAHHRTHDDSSAVIEMAKEVSRTLVAGSAV